MAEYYFVERLSEGLVRVRSRFGVQLFSSRKLRAQNICNACRRVLGKGEVAWGEVASCATNRSHRLCDDCMNAGELATDRIRRK